MMFSKFLSHLWHFLVLVKFIVWVFSTPSVLWGGGGGELWVGEGVGLGGSLGGSTPVLGGNTVSSSVLWDKSGFCEIRNSEFSALWDNSASESVLLGETVFSMFWGVVDTFRPMALIYARVVKAGHKKTGLCLPTCHEDSNFEFNNDALFYIIKWDT